MRVVKPNGEVYCEFSADDNVFYIHLKGGYKVYLDRKVIPDLKKFLETLEPAPENKF